MGGREYANKHGNAALMVEAVTMMIAGLAQRAEAEGARDVSLVARDAEAALYALLDTLAWSEREKLPDPGGD
ncbi:hypothetical protein [Methylobacterium sp. CM6247]